MKTELVAFFPVSFLSPITSDGTSEIHSCPVPLCPGIHILQILEHLIFPTLLLSLLLQTLCIKLH